MANIDKLVVEWSGFSGAPGYSVFYASPGNLVRADIITFLSAIADWLPVGVELSVPATGDTLDDATGTLVSTWSEGTTTTILGTSGGIYAAPAGLVVNWLTDGIANGKRVRGRTFFVPIGGNGLDSEGQLTATVRQDFITSAGNLVTAAGGALLVWHRPVAGVGGSSHAVVESRVGVKVAVLRSRRD